MKKVSIKWVVVTLSAASLILTACGNSNSSTVNDSQQTQLTENDNTVEMAKPQTDKDNGYNVSDIAAYLGVDYTTDNPYTYNLGDYEYITDNRGNLIEKVPQKASDSYCPSSSAFHGKCHNHYGEPVVTLEDREHNELISIEDGAIYLYEPVPGRDLYEVHTNQGYWLYDNNGKSVLDDGYEMDENGEDYYIARTHDYEHQKVYDAWGNVLYETDLANYRLEINKWPDLGEAYLYAMVHTESNMQGQGNMTIYHLPDMQVVFTAENVIDWNDLDGQPVYVLVNNIMDNNARVVAIREGKVVIDTVVGLNNNIIAHGVPRAGKLIIQHDPVGEGWCYSSYSLSSGEFISKNYFGSSEADSDEKYFDDIITDMEVNMGRARKLGLDVFTYDHGMDYISQYFMEARLFDCIEKETGRRIFYNVYEDCEAIVDDTNGQVLVSGTVMYADAPETQHRERSVFAYATDGTGTGKLVNLITGKSINVSGYIVGTQKVYATFMEEDGKRRVYNYDLDSFIIDEEGNSMPDMTYSELKEIEPEYNMPMVAMEDKDEKADEVPQETADTDTTADKAISTLRDYCVSRMVELSGENVDDARETVEEYWEYQMYPSESVTDRGMAYYTSAGVFRTFSCTLIVFEDGTVINIDEEPEEFEKYISYFGLESSDYESVSQLFERPGWIKYSAI